MDRNISKEVEVIKQERAKRKKSLKFKITVPVVTIIIAAVVIMGALGSYMSYYSTINCLKDSMITAADIANDAISLKLSRLSVMAEDIAQYSIMYSPDVSNEEKSAVLSRKASEYGFLNSFILSTDGKSISDGVDYSGTDYFQAGLRGSVFISSPSVDKESGELAITISSPIWENGVKNSSVIGVICLALPQGTIGSAIQDIHVSKNGYAYMLNKAGEFVVYKDNQFVIDKKNVNDMAAADHNLQPLADSFASALSGKIGFSQYTYQGVNKFVSFAPIEGSDGWAIFINAPVSDFTGGVTTTIFVSIGIMILFIAIGVFGSIFISKQVVNPISIFVDRLSKLADGDVTSPLPQFEATSTEFHILKQSVENTLSNTEDVITDIDYLLSEISNGNLDIFSNASEKYVGDYRHILTSFRRLKKNLTVSLQDVLTVAEQVSDGSAQVSAGAQSLAQGATEQASSIEELSASITEVAQHVMNNAEDAAKASALTNDAKGIMSGSFEEMEQARQAMDEISATSKNISKVIKAIDDIAFQTNILALNAAVEAARAGSAGKGFAVVADEVRNLSQKSAEAAKNTTALIESSIIAVEKGSTLVNKTSEDFALVAEKAAESSALVEEIAAKAQQQAAAISQIKVGIDQVSSVVQMNSATSEESAAASEELSSQAAVLKGLVDQFKLATSFASED